MYSPDCIAPDQLLAERYRVVRQLAPGGQARVFMARDQSSNDVPVVIKQLDSSIRGGYLRETSAGMDVVHPRIVRPIDTFYLGETVGCLVYEYFSEGTLRDWMEVHRKADRTTIRALMQDLLGALSYLHARRLIHCDIKPENLFLRAGPNGPQCYLGDLGATCTLREAREGKHRTGSPAYTAPERFYEKFHCNSDLYSVGVLCFELATGELPFMGTPAEITRAHLHEAPQLDKIESSSLRDFVTCLLEKDPERRVATAERALAILTNPAFQTARDVKPGDKMTVIESAPQKVVGRHNLNVLWRLEAPSQIEDMCLFHDGKEATVGFDHGSDLSLHSAHADPRVIAKAGRVHALSSHQLAYALDQHLYLYDTRSAVRCVLHDHVPGMLQFDVAGAEVAWRTRRAVHLHNRQKQTEINWICTHYLLDPFVAVLSDGYVAVSYGALNREVQIRDSAGQVLRTVELDGPVMGMTADRRAVLVLTLDMGSSDHYAVWRVSEFAAPEKLSLPSGVTNWCLTPGHLFWIDRESTVHHLGIGLNQRTLFNAPSQTKSIALSTDHAFVALAYTTPRGGSEVAVYQT